MGAKLKGIPFHLHLHPPPHHGLYHLHPHWGSSLPHSSGTMGYGKREDLILPRFERTEVSVVSLSLTLVLLDSSF